MTITVNGPIDQLRRGLNPSFEYYKNASRNGDVQATVLVCSEILYGVLANLDERLERLEETLKARDES